MDKTFVENVRGLHRLSDLVRTVVKLRPCAGGWIGLCPFHHEKNASFHVSDARGTYKCFGCGAWGDTFDWLMQTKGLSFQEAVRELQGGLEEPNGRHVPTYPRWPEVDAKEDDKRRIAHAHGVWLKREPIHGTLASRYLRETRGISGALPEILGFAASAYCSPLGEEVPALVAPLQDSAGHVTAVQQIFLCGETLDAYRDDRGKRIKRTLGAMRDGCVRLGLPDTCLGLAGSVEDALAASLLFSLPVWATCGEHRFERVWLPPEIEHLLIFADSDDAGTAAAMRARHVFQERMEVTIQAPEKAKDWAEILERRLA